MIEAEVQEVVTVPEVVVTEVQKEVARKTKETARFEVLLATRSVRFDRLVRRLDAEGGEVDSRLEHHQFDFAEILGKSRNGISGMDVYLWLRAEFDERDPVK